nr:ABC transporter permease subunit [Bacilli bacterium]
MNFALYSSEMKGNARTIASYAVGMLMYMALFIWIYPSFAGSQSLNQLLQQMPQGLLQVVGYTAGVHHIGDFLSGEFYSLLYLIIMGIYAIFAATKLVAHLVDTGALSYVLAMPVSRVKIAITQAGVLLSGVLIIAFVTTAGGLLFVAWWVPHAGMSSWYFVQMNILGTLLFTLISGYCFLFSCWLRDERSALGLSALLTLLFYGLRVIGDLTSKFSFVTRWSVFSLFDPQKLMHGQGNFIGNSLFLAVGTLLLYSVAIVIFRRRQFSL